MSSYLDLATEAQAKEHGLKPAEFAQLKAALGREINVLELGVCAALYSEHCSYKSSRVHLRGLPTSGPKVLQGPGENAGIIDIGDGEAVVFKVESHNHPSFIEPYQGAATGVGGILRDIFTMGARPIALLNALRFGELTDAKQRYLLRRAVQGIGGYGNCMGIPTVGGELYFHNSFAGNCLVNAFALGIVKHEHIFKGQATGVGNSLMYVGSKTGRDGIRGANMASESFEENSDEKRPTVQVGDPFQEKLLLEACLEVMQMKNSPVVGIQDMGAAGLTSSTYEMADRAGNGVRLDLDQVPQRETEMNPYELMLSESQERMLMVVTRGRETEVQEIFKKWDLDAVKVGEVIAGGDVDLYWHGKLVSRMPAAALTRSVPVYNHPMQAPAERGYGPEVATFVNENYSFAARSALVAEMLASPNLCSRRALYEQYDSTVRTNTVVAPGSDAAVVRVKNNPGAEAPQCTVKELPAYKAEEISGVEKGIAMTLDCNSLYCGVDPARGTALSLAQSIRNLACVGAEAIGISDNLNFASPERPEGMWQLAESVRGLSEAARAFNAPIISGNVSLYNETKGQGILPTPLLAVVGLMPDASVAVPGFVQEAGLAILGFGTTNPTELGGSEYAHFRYKSLRGPLPALDYKQESATASFIRGLVRDRLVVATHDVGDGGLAIAFAELGLAKQIGVTATLTADEAALAQGRETAYSFAESTGRFLVALRQEQVAAVKKRAKELGIVYSLEGTTGGDTLSIANLFSIPVALSSEQWKKGLEPYFVD